MSKPSIQEIRAALAQLIITKDQISAATTQFISELDRAAQFIDGMGKDDDSTEDS
jgi:hypothetical protein